jgi:hypothetical protein
MNTIKKSLANTTHIEEELKFAATRLAYLESLIESNKNLVCGQDNFYRAIVTKCRRCLDWSPDRFYMSAADSDICATCPKGARAFWDDFRNFLICQPRGFWCDYELIKLCGSARRGILSECNTESCASVDELREFLRGKFIESKYKQAAPCNIRHKGE